MLLSSWIFIWQYSQAHCPIFYILNGKIQNYELQKQILRVSVSYNKIKQAVSFQTKKIKSVELSIYIFNYNLYAKVLLEKS